MGREASKRRGVGRRRDGVGVETCEKVWDFVRRTFVFEVVRQNVGSGGCGISRARHNYLCAACVRVCWLFILSVEVEVDRTNRPAVFSLILFCFFPLKN